MTQAVIQKLKKEITREVMTKVKRELNEILERFTYDAADPAKLQKLEKISRSLDQGGKKRVFSGVGQLEKYLDSLDGSR